MYGGMCAIIVAHAMHTYCVELGHSHFICVSNLKYSNHWKWALTVHFGLYLASSFLSMVLLL